MTGIDHTIAGLRARRRILDQLSATDDYPRALAAVADRIAGSLRSGGTIYFCGNGGSAADSDHIAAEFVGRFRMDRRPLPAIALTVSAATITAIANDYSADEIFSRQVSAFARDTDVVVGLSTSGRSINVIRALETARAKGAFTVAFTGENGDKLAAVADQAILIPTADTAAVQELTLMSGHLLCGQVESLLGLSDPQQGVDP
jgi:D-sedoheptulose 7-phosphate isomerase